jgi:hypothetical protein
MVSVPPGGSVGELVVDGDLVAVERIQGRDAMRTPSRKARRVSRASRRRPPRSGPLTWCQMCSSPSRAVTPAKRSGPVSIALSSGAMERHTVRHVVRSWRAIPATEACSRRNCRIAHQDAVCSGAHAVSPHARRARGTRRPGRLVRDRTTSVLHHRTRTGRPNDGASTRGWTRQPRLTASIPHVRQPITCGAVSTSTISRSPVDADRDDVETGPDQPRGHSAGSTSRGCPRTRAGSTTSAQTSSKSPLKRGAGLRRARQQRARQQQHMAALRLMR